MAGFLGFLLSVCAILQVGRTRDFDEHIRYAMDPDLKTDRDLSDLSGLARMLQKGCGGVNADIAFVLDNSASIWGPDFRKQTAFVRDFIKVFDVAPDRVRIAAVTYADVVYSSVGFGFNKYKTEDEVTKAIMEIPYKAGRQTRTDKALVFLRSVIFRRTRRQGVEHIVVVLTDGDSLFPPRTARAARALKYQGVTIYAIGVGGSVSTAELKAIASSRENVFKVDNYDALQNIKKQLGVEMCPEPTTPVPTIPPCGVADPADVNFICDAVQMDQAANREVKEIVHSFVGTEAMQDDGMQVALITSECPELQNVPFNHYMSQDKLNFSEVFDNVHYQSYGSLVDILRTEGFSVERGGRESARHIGVVIMTDQPDNIKELVEKAELAKKDGIELFAVGLRKRVKRKLLQKIASFPKKEHVIVVGSRDEIAEVGPKIANALCPRNIATKRVKNPEFDLLAITAG